MKSRVGRVVILIGVLWLSGRLSAQQRSAGTLLILHRQERRLAIVDAASLRVLATVPVGANAREVAASTDGRVAYIAHDGAGTGHTMTTVDLITRKPLGVIDLGTLTQPHGLTYVDGHLWFLAEGAKAVGRYLPGTHTVDQVVGTGEGCARSLYVEKGERQIITSSQCAGTLSLFDRDRMPRPRRAVSQAISGGTVQHPGLPALNDPSSPGPRSPAEEEWRMAAIPVGRGAEGFDVSPDGKQIWVANTQDATLSILDRASRAVVATIPSFVSAPERLRFTPDGTRVLVSASGSGEVAIVDASRRTLVKRITVGRGVSSLLIQPDGLRAYAACSQDSYVAVIDLIKLAVIQRIPAAHGSDDLAFAP